MNIVKLAAVASVVAIATVYADALLAQTASATSACPNLLRHSFAPIQGGEPRSLCDYHGKVLLVVNTASQCGYTPQYEGLEALYRRYQSRGLVVIGFPSNDFGGQEPGSNQQIAEFCRTVYGVQFPMYEKQRVKTLAAKPLYAELAAKSGAAPRWNFHKFLVAPDGRLAGSWPSRVEPDAPELIAAIEAVLPR